MILSDEPKLTQQHKSRTLNRKKPTPGERGGQIDHGVRAGYWVKLALSGALAFAIIWLSALAVLQRDYADAIAAANERVAAKSQIFAQHILSTIRRVDQITREAALVYERTPADIRNFIARQIDLVRDIAFQITVVDRDGIAQYSSLNPSNSRVDLSGREHFRVHKESNGEDRLFISRPVVGKISKQWAIQFTRPILNNGTFNGIVVVSVDPAQFGAFGKDLDLGKGGVASIARDTGERMARYPIAESMYGEQLPAELPIWSPNSPRTGSFPWHTRADGIDRIYGYTRLPDYGLTTLVGETLESALALHHAFRIGVISFACFATVFFGLVLFLVYRWSRDKASRDEGWRSAKMDSLTGLSNRRGFMEAISSVCEAARRDGTSFALLFLDIDQFKTVNDTLGHSVGDALLVAVSGRLQNSLRQNDQVARIGGDEFTIILRDMTRGSDIEAICQKLLHELAVPLQLSGNTVHVSGSIGVAIFPDDATEVEMLLGAADQAMYVSKVRGRNRATFFSRSFQSEAAKRATLINDLHVAVSEGQLCVYYQPIVDAVSGKIQKAEALVRWQHPTLGLITAAEFVPYATDAGLINLIDHFVLGEVAAMLRSLPAELLHDIQIAANKSATDIRSEPDIEGVLAASKDLVGNIVLEITETGLLNDEPQTLANLLRLSEHGIPIALDDFGTGYSSLSYLARFPVNYLKIDQSFVRGVLNAGSREAMLCESIVLLAHKMGIKVIAEGVENEEQRAWLIDIGCDFLQGFHLFRPMNDLQFSSVVIEQAVANG